MEYRVLGPLDVRDDDRSLPLAGAKQRALLALLLLSANRVVSRDRLIDELWGERPPETAVQSLQVYVSRLRKLLPVGALLTRPPGYLLEVEPHELDLRCFERLRAEGHTALAEDDPERAAHVLREALALWRGPALAEFASESFAHPEIGRLEDLRLAAVEERIEADLALGRHSDLIGELEALVAEHPHRERLRAQLMLALYRSARQTEALAAYQDARRTLDELGIQPSTELHELERAILTHDPALGVTPTRRARTASSPASTLTLLTGRSDDLAQASPRTDVDAPALPAATAVRRMSRRRLLAGTAGLAAAVAGVAAFGLRRDHPTEVPDLAPLPVNSVGLVDPRTNELVDAVVAGIQPSSIAAGNGGLWFVNAADGTVMHVDPDGRGIVRTVPVGAHAIGVAVGAGAVWLATVRHRAPQEIRLELWRVHPRFHSLERVVVSADFAAFATSAPAVAVGAGAVWFGAATRVFRFRPRTRETTLFDVPAAHDIAVGEGAVWVVGTSTGDDTGVVADVVTRVDPATGAVAATLAAGVDSTIDIGRGSVWLASGADETVRRLDPETNVVAATIDLGRSPVDIAVGEGAVWTANDDGTISRIDWDTNQVVATIELGRRPDSIAAGEGGVWVSVY